MPTMDEFKGINNVDAAEDLDAEELRAAVNVDIDNNFKIKRRSGTTQIYAGTNVHSLFSNKISTLFVEDGDLKLLNADNTATALRSGISRFGRVAYEDLDEDIYVTDGNVTGIYKDGAVAPMGIPTPPTRPVLVSANGILPAGRYSVIFTAVDGTGVESGSTHVECIELTSEGSITVTGIPASMADADKLYVYITEPDGEVFYRHGEVAFGTASYSITTKPDGPQCRTMGLDQMPAGHILAHHQGRMYVAVGSVIYYSEPYQYGLTNLTRNFVMFKNRVTLIAPEPQGIFVSAKDDKTYYIAGSDPDQFAMVVKADYPALENTATRVHQDELGDGVNGAAWVWASRYGVCSGIIGGSFRNMTRDKYAIRTGDIGAALFRQKDGISHYIGIIHADDNGVNKLYTSDVATAEIRRNGVIIT